MEKVLYGEYGAAVRRVFIVAAICPAIVITALSNPSYDCMCHARSMRPRHRASLRARIIHFFATAKRVDPFLLIRGPGRADTCATCTRVLYYRGGASPFFVDDRARTNYREKRAIQPK